jgi:hypothetical protein
MAKRPAFFVQDPSHRESSPVEVATIDFEWFPGMAKSQKQKSIDSLHGAIQKQRPSRVLEISSKSRDELGIKLSAFNLGFFHPKSKKFVCVESAFQGSKVFKTSGPFHGLYTQSAREAKRFLKNKELGPLVRFDFYGQSWPLSPMTLFYDWLYLKSLSKNPIMAKKVLEYDCFTDIEFNPKKSINCQAYSAALFVSLDRRGLIASALENRDEYIRLMRNVNSWIEATEYAKYHKDIQGRCLSG